MAWSGLLFIVAIIAVIVALIAGGGWLAWIGWTITGWLLIVLGVACAAIFGLLLMTINVQ